MLKSYNALKHDFKIHLAGMDKSASWLSLGGVDGKPALVLSYPKGNYQAMGTPDNFSIATIDDKHSIVIINTRTIRSAMMLKNGVGAHACHITSGYNEAGIESESSLVEGSVVYQASPLDIENPNVDYDIRESIIIAMISMLEKRGYNDAGANAVEEDIKYYSSLLSTIREE